LTSHLSFTLNDHVSKPVTLRFDLTGGGKIYACTSVGYSGSDLSAVRNHSPRRVFPTHHYKKVLSLLRYAAIIVFS
jgi:hypothetical protein